mmetsp:Transcript_10334/g.11388  ORF Transcript_10334/g.11388 Transcript_10334/m.11388 type:complete len:162 (+) Transcript_10334:38-523(+)
MANWDEKSKPISVQTGNYSWSQTRETVEITIDVPDGTRGRDVVCIIKTDSLKFALKGKDPILDGKLFENVKADDSTWTIEDRKLVRIVLEKSIVHNSWTSVIKGKDELDPITKEKMDKRMLLEKFQSEHGGFDFSGAEFNGGLPKDPKNFLANLGDRPPQQ